MISQANQIAVIRARASNGGKVRVADLPAVLRVGFVRLKPSDVGSEPIVINAASQTNDGSRNVGKNSGVPELSLLTQTTLTLGTAGSSV